MAEWKPEGCLECGRTLTGEDVGLTKKYINRGSKRFYCISCLAKKLGVTEDYLHKRAEYFKKIGCALF